MKRNVHATFPIYAASIQGHVERCDQGHDSNPRNWSDVTPQQRTLIDAKMLLHKNGIFPMERNGREANRRHLKRGMVQLDTTARCSSGARLNASTQADAIRSEATQREGQVALLTP